MDAVDQIINYTFKGSEVLFRITGAAAKNLAVLIAALLKDTYKTSGKTRMSRFYREGKDQKVITIPREQQRDFNDLAKRYGILYCVIDDKRSQDLDLIVKTEDIAKVKRIYDRLGWGEMNTVADINAVQPSDISKDANVITIAEPELLPFEQELADLEYKRDDLAADTGSMRMNEEIIRERGIEPDRFPEAEIEGLRNKVEAAEKSLQEAQQNIRGSENLHFGYEAQLHTAEIQLNDCKQYFKEAELQCASAKDQATALSKRYANSKSQLEDATNKHESNQKDLQEATQLRQHSVKQLDELKKQESVLEQKAERQLQLYEQLKGSEQESEARLNLEDTLKQHDALEQDIQNAEISAVAADDKMRSVEMLFKQSEKHLLTVSERHDKNAAHLKVSEQGLSAAEERLKIAKHSLDSADQYVKNSEIQLKDSEKRLVELEQAAHNAKENLKNCKQALDACHAKMTPEIITAQNEIKKAEAALKEKYGLDRKSAEKEVQTLDAKIDALRKEGQSKNPTNGPDRSNIDSNGSFHRNNKQASNERSSVKQKLDEIVQQIKQAPAKQQNKGRTKTKAATQEKNI